MKRLYISIAMAAFALFVAFFSFCDVSRNCNRMITSLENAVSAIGENDAEKSRGELDNALRLWHKCRNRFEFYLYSEDLYEIDLNFDKIEKLSDSYDSGELSEICYENVNRIKRLAENQSPTLNKVF